WRNRSSPLPGSPGGRPEARTPTRGIFPAGCAWVVSGTASGLRMSVTMFPMVLYYMVVSLDRPYADLLLSMEAERQVSAAAGSGSADWVGRGRGSLLLFPRPPTEPCGTVSVLHGSPVGTIHRIRTPGITPPSPAIVLHLWPCALWLAFPASDDYGHSVTLGLSSRRPSRSSMMQHYSVREAVHSCLPRPHWAGLDPQRAPRPSACLCDESTWR